MTTYIDTNRWIVQYRNTRLRAVAAYLFKTLTDENWDATGDALKLLESCNPLNNI